MPIPATPPAAADRTRVAILGGGPAGLAAASGLSSTPDLRARYEVTVYQAGWRVGGKCGQGRQGPMNRIDQNGTHYLFGAYDNCFRVAREAYDVLEAEGDDRFGTYEDQFIPRSKVALMQFFRGEWHVWPLEIPTNRGVPGEGGELPTLSEFLSMALQWMIEVVAGQGTLSFLHKEGFFPAREHEHWWTRGIGTIVKGAGKAVDYVGLKLLRLAVRLLEDVAGDELKDEVLEDIAGLVGTFRKWLWHCVDDVVDESLTARRVWTLLDLGASIVIGAIEDDIFTTEGLEAIDQYDLREWLQKHGCTEMAAYSEPITAWYNAIAAYADGDTDTPNMSAAAGLHGMFRLGLTYKGAFAWQMAAEVGDSVIAPLFAALRHRGVRFAFFQRVWDLIPSDDGSHVDAVEVEIQKAIKAGPYAYEPFITVKGRSVWPDQLRGEQLTDPTLCVPPLDSFYTSCSGPRHTLKRGQDYDVLIWAIPVPAMATYCTKLLAQKADLANMVDKLRVTETQSLRVWMKPDLEGLGWTYGPSVMSAYYQPLATWEDNSQLIETETWPPNNRPGSMATLFGPLASDGTFPPHTDSGYPGARLEIAQARGMQFLDYFVGPLWPRMTRERGGPGVDWAKLAVWDESRKGAERYMGQAPRANVGPIESYTQIHSGTLSARRRVDETGYDDFYIAGDWVRNGFEVGSVEGAVMSGLQASRAICGSPEDIPGSRGL
jgi:uncharacterized protein with NAD-binding domain and iron-sulfur cluster